MDAYRHLQGLGWRGSGFSLDKSDRGLKKPLLVSRKFDSRGVGSKTPAGRQADHWWLTAYDSALSTLGDKSQSGTSILHQVQEGGYNSSWIYAKFAKGETLASTFTASHVDDPYNVSTTSNTVPEAGVTSSESNKKRKLEEKSAAADILPRAPLSKKPRNGASDPPPEEERAEAKTGKVTKRQPRPAVRKSGQARENGPAGERDKGMENAHEDRPEKKATWRMDRIETQPNRKKKKKAGSSSQGTEIVHGPLQHRSRNHFATGVDEEKLGTSADKLENIPGAASRYRSHSNPKRHYG